MKLRAPEGVNMCSVDGNNYVVGDDGLFDIPDTSTTPLIDHGFVVVPDEPAKKEAKK